MVASTSVSTAGVTNIRALRRFRRDLDTGKGCCAHSGIAELSVDERGQLALYLVGNPVGAAEIAAFHWMGVFNIVLSAALDQNLLSNTSI